MNLGYRSWVGQWGYYWLGCVGGLDFWVWIIFTGRFNYYVLYPRSKKQISLSPSKKDHNQNQKPPLILYYQKVLPQALKCQHLPIKPTQISESYPCYMFAQASPSYSQNFPPLENFDHPQTNTKHVWKIKNPVGGSCLHFCCPTLERLTKKTKIVFNSHKYKGNSKQAFTCFQFPVPTKHRESNLETTIIAYLDRGEKEGE